jgi:hypothetical protein
VKQASAVQIGDRLAMPSRTVTAIQPVMMTQRGQARQRPPTMLTLESRADDGRLFSETLFATSLVQVEE